jgi:hypothetical protein
VTTSATGPALGLGPEFPRHLRSREPLPFRHRLVDHPALQRAAIVELAGRLPTESVTQEAAVKPLVYADGAPEPTRTAAAADLVRNLDSNEAWLTLLNVEQDAQYRALIDEQLDALAGALHVPPRDWRRRMGFVFASSPGSVTGAHFDIEHSLLLQLQGRRKLGFGDWPDDETRDREISRYWRGSYGKLTTLPVPRQELTVEAGDGVYIPPYRPHWLYNGDAASLSLTITFFTRENEDESLVQACNERLRKLRLHPRPYGRSPALDRFKVAVMRARAAVAGGYEH